jgi:hypothetical protein
MLNTPRRYGPDVGTGQTGEGQTTPPRLCLALTLAPSRPWKPGRAKGSRIRSLLDRWHAMDWKKEGDDEWIRHFLDSRLKTENTRDSYRHIAAQYTLLHPLDPRVVN